MKVETFLDGENTPIDVNAFIEKYYHQNELIELLTTESELNEHVEKKTKVKTQSEHISEETRRTTIQRKINNCLLYYLLTECDEYTIISNKRNKMNRFISVCQSNFQR